MAKRDIWSDFVNLHFFNTDPVDENLTGVEALPLPTQDSAPYLV